MAKDHKGTNTPVIIDALDYNYKNFDVAILFLTLMFIQPSKRAEFINTLRAKRKANGIIIILDKFMPRNGYEGLAFLRLTMEAKLKSGESYEDVLKKELSLIGVQRPINKTELGKHETFFKYADFEGVIITD